MSLTRGFGQHLRGTTGTLLATAAVFLLVSGIGAATSYLRKPHEATGSGDRIKYSQPHSGSEGDMLAHLKDYTRAIGADKPASKAEAAD